MRGRGGEERRALPHRSSLSILTSCAHSGLETHALAGKAGKAGTRDRQQTRRLPFTDTFSPDLILLPFTSLLAVGLAKEGLALLSHK